MRNKLIQKLASEWRYAENYFIETEDDSKKWKVLTKQNKAKLTPAETKELEEIMRGMGI